MIILLIILLALVALVIVIALRPPTFVVERSASVLAPAATVFAQVNDFRLWPAWSPFEKFDPAVKRTYLGPATGTGSVYAWDGNRQAGAGKATITESQPGERIEMKLEFFRPFAATNAAKFTFQPSGSQTIVTWRMSGKCHFMAKAFGLLMNSNKMIGEMFAEGLANLKRVAENSPQPT
jgi:hypothetical protein